MPHLRQAQWTAYGSCGLFSASQALLFVMYPILAEKLGLSLSQVVLCFSVGSFLFLWGGPFWALKSDRVGRARILRITQGGCLLSLLALILLLSPWRANPQVNFGILLSSRIFYGLVASGLIPVAQALALDFGASAEKTKAAATYSMFLNMGRFIGPVLGLTIVSASPLYLLAALSAAFLGLMAFSPRLPHAVPEAEVEIKHRRALSHLWPEGRDKRAVVLFALFTTIFLGLLQSSLGAYLKSVYHLTAEGASHQMSRLLILAALTTVAVQFGMRTKLRNPWQGSLPSGVLALSGGCALMLAFERLEVLYVAVLFMSLGIALLTPSYTSLMSYLSGSRQGEGAGALSVAHTLGYAMGGGLSSLGLMVSARFPFWINLAACVALLVLIPRLYASRPQPLNTLEEESHVRSRA